MRKNPIKYDQIFRVNYQYDVTGDINQFPVILLASVSGDLISCTKTIYGAINPKEYKSASRMFDQCDYDGIFSLMKSMNTPETFSIDKNGVGEIGVPETDRRVILNTGASLKSGGPLKKTREMYRILYSIFKCLDEIKVARNSGAGLIDVTIVSKTKNGNIVSSSVTEMIATDI